ncbi:uncharacterized, partial [Tachysurus ichikawai]
QMQVGHQMALPPVCCDMEDSLFRIKQVTGQFNPPTWPSGLQEACAAIKMELLAVKHGLAYSPCASQHHQTAIDHSCTHIALFIERENKGLSR